MNAQENYVTRTQNLEHDIKSFYLKNIAHLSTNIPNEDLTILKSYNTEAKHLGSGKPLYTVIDQHAEKNKRLR